MRSVPFEFVRQLASEFGASLSGPLPEVWFAQLPSAFASKWAAVSVPVTVPDGSIRLSGGQRGGRVRVVVHPPSAC